MGSSKREINRAEMICSSHVCPHSVSACLFFVYMGLSLNSKRTQGSEDFQARGNERRLKNELLISVELTQMAKRKKKKVTILTLESSRVVRKVNLSSTLISFLMAK